MVLDEQRSPTEDYVEAFYLLEREFADGMLGGPAPVQLAVEQSADADRDICRLSIGERRVFPVVLM